MALKGISVNTLIINGDFTKVSGVERVEDAISFVLMFYGVRREYKEYFSTRFLYATVQQNTSLADPSLLLLRLKSLLNESIPEFSTEAVSFARSNTSRKTLELLLEYKYVSPETDREEFGFSANFLPFQ